MGGRGGRRLRSSGDLLGGGLGLRGSGDVPVRILCGGFGLGDCGTVLLRLGSGRRIDGGPVLLRLCSFRLLGDCSVLGGGDVGNGLLDVPVLVLLRDGLAFTLVSIGVLDLLYHGDGFALGLVPFGIGLRGGGRGGGRRTVFTDIRPGLDLMLGAVQSFRRLGIDLSGAAILVLLLGARLDLDLSLIGDGGLRIRLVLASGDVAHGCDVIDELEVAAFRVISEGLVVVDALMVLYPILPGTVAHVDIPQTE